MREGEVVGQIVIQRRKIMPGIGMMLPVDQNIVGDHRERGDVAAVGFVTTGTSVLSEDPKCCPSIAKVIQIGIYRPGSSKGYRQA